MSAAPPSALDRSIESCNGLARYAFIDKPDTKFNPDGLFKVKLVCDLDDASVQAFKSTIDGAVEEAFTSELKRQSKAGWGRYLPYEMELDAVTDEPTGKVIFEFKRNAKVVLAKTREAMALSVAVFDSTGYRVQSPPPVPNGSLVRVIAHLRPIKLTATRYAGVRMDFAAMKVLRLAVPPSPFSEDDIEDGWKAPRWY